jgi:hypothetical protein
VTAAFHAGDTPRLGASDGARGLGALASPGRGARRRAGIGPLGLARDEDVVGREHPRDGDPHRALERARVADLAGGHGERQRLGRGDDRAALVGQARLGIVRLQRRAVSRRPVQVARRDARVRLDQARSGGDEIAQRARGREHLEHLSRRHREEEIEPRRDPFALEKRRRGQEVAQRRPAVAPEDGLGDGTTREIADRPHLAVLVLHQRVDGSEVDVHDLLARRSRVRGEGAVRLGAPLIAQENLGSLIAHEDRPRGAELRGDGREDAPLADRQGPRARTGELHDDRGAARLLDPTNDVGQTAAQKLERHVARTDERSQATAEQHLHAHRRPDRHRPMRQRVRKRRGGHHQGEHPRAARACETRLVGNAEARRAGEALEVHRRGETDAGARHEDPVREELACGQGRTSLALARTPGDAPAVVRDRDLDGDLLQPGCDGMPQSPHRRARENDLIDARIEHVVGLAQPIDAARGQQLARPRREDLLGHRAGRIPGSCAHVGRFPFADAAKTPAITPGAGAGK